MARIRGSDTAPEVALRVALAARGILPSPAARAPVGRPDLVLADSRTAVFIDGCFWHGCPLHYARPRTRDECWAAKLVSNIERDARQCEALVHAGWVALRLWEHDIVEDPEEVAAVVEQVLMGAGAPRWEEQRRVRRVIDLGDCVERRLVVLLGDPASVVEVTEGLRVTAKARARRR